jgi:hypothetical protein
MGTDKENRSGNDTLAERLEYIEKLEGELLRKVAVFVSKESTLNFADFFLIGATKRAVAQSCGFRELIRFSNFPCAAGILRMQIDTCMRVNAFHLVTDIDEFARELFNGRRFNLLSDANRNKLTDKYLRNKLAVKYPWITKVYESSSDFVHLSMRHYYSAVSSVNADTHEVRFLIAGSDPPRADEVYFEIVDTFFEVSKLLALELLGYFGARAGLGREPS